MLAYHILIPVLCAMAMNGFIYTCNMKKNTSPKVLYNLPPGFIIGIIWTILFGLLGYVHFLLYSLRQKPNVGSMSVVLFILFSLTYPVIPAYYANLFNIITLVLSFVVGMIVMMYSKYIFLYMIPLLAWVLYVNVINKCYK